MNNNIEELKMLQIEAGVIFLEVSQQFKNIIKEWVYIPNWSPNFINYWKTSAIAMPEPLKLFLKNELGIII